MATKKPNIQLLAQAVRVFRNNQRKAMAKTKTRSEVSKTTAKMYRQKGTGRARHGAYSAPIFVGGGVAFGPTGEQSYARKLSKEQIRIATISAMELRKKDITAISLDRVKTTKAAAKKIAEYTGSKLVVLGNKELSAGKYFRNIEKVTVASAKVVSAYQIMKNKHLLFTEAATQEIKERYAN